MLTVSYDRLIELLEPLEQLQHLLKPMKVQIALLGKTMNPQSKIYDKFLNSQEAQLL